MAKIYQQWIDKSDIEHKYYQIVITDISDDLEAKYKQNTYSVIYIETGGSRHDWKEDDDEESESIEEETWRGRTDLVILHATSNFL